MQLFGIKLNIWCKLILKCHFKNQGTTAENMQGVTLLNLAVITFFTFPIMNNEKFPLQISEVKVTVNSTLNSTGFIVRIDYRFTVQA